MDDDETHVVDANGFHLFRPKDFPDDQWKLLLDNYEKYRNLITIIIHHGGVFTSSPGRDYIFGDEVIVDYIDSDHFSLHEFNFIVRKLPYDEKEIMYYHFLKPDSKDLDNGLLPFGSDDDVIKMIGYVKKSLRKFDFYIEHKISTVETNMQSNVVIEDLEDDDVLVVEKPMSFRRLLLEGVQESCENPSFMDNTAEYDVGGPSMNAENAQNVETEHVGGPSVETANDEFFKDNLHTSDKVNEVDVDMSDFKDHCERDDHWLKKGVDVQLGNLEINEEVRGINFDEYDSGEGSDGDERNKKLRKLNKQIKCPLQPGKLFMDKKQIIVLVKKHAVESRRELKFVKNDSVRIRVCCEGRVPNYKKGETDSHCKEKGENISHGKEKGENNSHGKESCTVEEGNKDKGKKVIDQTPTCPWTLHVSKTKQDKHWSVKTLKEEHTCSQSRHLKWASSTFLSQYVGDTCANTPNISGKALQSQLMKQFQLGIDRQVVYRAKDKAMNQLRGNYVEQYANLRNYALELQFRNPETTVKIEVEHEPNMETSDTRVFKRIYICLGALKKGFKAGGRELLGLDGAFMRGPYPGQVLTAVGVDANNGIYPLAYAIVEAETKSSWTWFLQCLGEDLDLTNRSNFTFISDRQKGIIPALESVFPSAEHRFCLRHIHENLKAHFKCGEVYKDILWKCATSTTVPEFEHAMAEINTLSNRVHDWLRAIPPKHWVRAYFSGRAHCDILLNNICESFNSKLVDGRERPIITCLEYIREYMMRRIALVQKVIDKSKGPLTPTATEIFEVTKAEAHDYNVVFNGKDQYQVSGPWQDQAVVNMTLKSCSCRKWELTGLPCKHVVAALMNMDDNGNKIGSLEDWVHMAYRLETWREVYDEKINPCTGVSTWPISNCPTKLLPPYHKTQVGRPCKKRKKSAGESSKPMVKEGKLSRQGKTVTCQKCKQMGHNSKTCKGQRQASSSQPTKSKKRKQPGQSQSSKMNDGSQPTQPTQASQSTQPPQPTQASQSTQPPQPTQASQASNNVSAAPAASFQRTMGESPRKIRKFSATKWVN